MEKEIIKVDPFVSVNGIEFGTSRDKIREILGKPEKSFLKSYDDIETDIYGCFHMFYDRDYKFEGIEVVCVDGADICYDGEKVPETYHEALDFFKKRFDDIKEDGAGFLSVQGSMGVYVEDADEYDTILFAKKGYYNELYN